MHVTEKMADFK